MEFGRGFCTVKQPSWVEYEERENPRKEKLAFWKAGGFSSRAAVLWVGSFANTEGICFMKSHWTGNSDRETGFSEGVQRCPR